MTRRSSASDPLWYKDAIIYELPVKSFYDGNGDGIGDFAGLIDKLDYVQELGVTCLWLLPFFPSPLRDDGYDIADYRSIHPSYGTLDDFKRFLEAAHARRLQVIIELVVNHTSDQHAVVPGRAHGAARSAGARRTTSGATRTSDIRMRASSSSTRSDRTGPGIRSRRRTTGTASFSTSPI